MKYILTFFLASIIAYPGMAQFKYINPQPGSADHTTKTTIILRNGNFIDRESLNQSKLVEIKGSASGKHDWSARLSDDNKTVIIKPIPVFDYGETVFVTIHSKLRKQTGEKIDGLSFSFNIENKITPEEAERFRQADRQLFVEEYGYAPTDKNSQKVSYPLDSMPTYKINVNNNPAPGRIFFNNHEDQTGPLPNTNSFTTVIQNDGTIAWARDVGKDGHDFKVNENGYLSYFISEPGHIWMIMDSNYNIIDSVQCKNGYELSTNNHDVMMYPDGHTLLIADKNKTIDMTAYGGVPNATVHFLVIQELDSNRDVIFEWRSQDHFLITDANQYTSLTNQSVDYVHCNSIERDFDGNILISSRNMDELTKIDFETGDIIWRMGGENNQFTFVNDNNEKHFAFQHDLRRISNGHITIFNNGNKMDPEISSAKEYALDEVNKIATLVWYYEHPDVNGLHVYGSATGNAQRLPNGNTMIDWGLITANAGIPNHTEVDSNKNIVWEMTFDSSNQKSYRVHKYRWTPCSRITGYTMSTISKPGSTTLKWGAATGAKSYRIQYRLLTSSSWTLAPSTHNLKMKLTGLMPSATYVWQVQTLCSMSPHIVSAYSLLDTFTTPPQKILDTELSASLLSLYPVPSADRLTIELSEPMDAGISVLNMLGSVMYNNELLAEKSAVLQVNTASWPAGVYTVRLDDGLHPALMKKFVKQ